MLGGYTMDTKLLCAVEEYRNGRRLHAPAYPKTEKIDEEIAAVIDQRIHVGMDEESLYELVLRYIRRLNNDNFYRKNGNLNEAAFYQQALIDKSTWSELRWNQVVPTKKTLLKLVIALHLNEAEATELMHKGSSSFDPKDIRDQIILALIDLRRYDICEVYDVLEEYRLNGPRPFENIYTMH